MDITSGIDGEAFGVEANAFAPQQIGAIILDCIGNDLHEVSPRESDVYTNSDIIKRLDGLENLVAEILNRLE